MGEVWEQAVYNLSVFLESIGHQSGNRFPEPLFAPALLGPHQL